MWRLKEIGIINRRAQGGICVVRLTYVRYLEPYLVPPLSVSPKYGEASVELMIRLVKTKFQ